MDYWQQKILNTSIDFDSLQQEIWSYQYAHNPIMHTFADALSWPEPISMPIDFFKRHAMKAKEWEAKAIFESSGTTGQTPSRHHVKDVYLYEQNTLNGFFEFFPRKKYRVLALLPSYLERGNSSLVHMVKTWIDHFGLPGSGFYLYNFEELRQSITEAGEAGEHILLIGVTFALLDFVEEQSLTLPPDTFVIETGGMKGRKKEMVRSELHRILTQGLGVPHIYSEYGMTEMMSQAYLMQDGRFRPASTLKLWTSDIHLDRLVQPFGTTGRLHIIDLANVHSCSFLATDDLGKVYEDGSFEVLGRLDTSEIRGCNLMYL